MSRSFGTRFVEGFKRVMPDSFVFALLLTLICAVLAVALAGATPFAVIESWYKGFWSLLEFGMQMVLILVTGYAIALSTPVRSLMNRLAEFINTPGRVYVFVMIAGTLFGFVSWGWVVITAVLARNLAERVKGVDYRYLVACVYLSSAGWVSGLSSSIPLVLNTEGNFLIESNLLSEKIPTALTLGSSLNLTMMVFYVVVPPVLMFLLKPRPSESEDIEVLRTDTSAGDEQSIEEEAAGQSLGIKALSDFLNNSRLLQFVIVAMGGTYIVSYFLAAGFDLNLSIMIFTFLILGMLLHQTPMRYVIAMKRAAGNISGIVFQYPFYAGIMGIMIYSGLGSLLGSAMASNASTLTYPFFSYVAGGLVNFAIPSAGGEFAVLAPSVLEAVKELGAGLPAAEQARMVATASLSIAYGETLTNMLQPFFFLTVTPVMGAGVNLQVRDVMGYLFIPFLVYFVIQSLILTFVPV